MRSTADDRLRAALIEALSCADRADNTLLGAMIADCLAQLDAQACREADIVRH